MSPVSGAGVASLAVLSREQEGAAAPCGVLAEPGDRWPLSWGP